MGGLFSSAPLEFEAACVETVFLPGGPWAAEMPSTRARPRPASRSTEQRIPVRTAPRQQTTSTFNRGPWCPNCKVMPLRTAQLEHNTPST